MGLKLLPLKDQKLLSHPKIPIIWDQNVVSHPNTPYLFKFFSHSMPLGAKTAVIHPYIDFIYMSPPSPCTTFTKYHPVQIKATNMTNERVIPSLQCLLTTEGSITASCTVTFDTHMYNVYTSLYCVVY